VEYPVVEHRRSRPARWLREHRIWIAIWVAVAEGVLVVFDQISKWVALAVAAAVLAFYALVARNLRNDVGRQVSWIAALSQVFVAMVPVLVFVIGLFTLIVVGILAVIALVLLFADRR
jgi:hypothetical protein